MIRISPLLVLLLFSMSDALAPIRTVTIVGGTHGNEYTGVWCVKELEHPSALNRLKKSFPSLDISTMIGNPEAHLANRRFIDTDLNREFTAEKLQSIQDLLAENPNADLPLETLRAQKINQLIGPKPNPKTDVVVDLHTTTSNMGITIIIAEGDALMGQAAAYVLHKCRQDPIRTKPNTAGPPARITEDAHIILMPIPDRNDQSHLGSVAQHEFTIEVGPVPQGVIRQDCVEKTKQALDALLEFLEQHNNQDKSNLQQDMNECFPKGRVPCYCSAKPRPGQLSGKIQWPSADHNPNFPAYMVHQSVQDQDFKPLKKGDPLFVDMQGDVIPYDGAYGDAIYLMFINEGGYYYASSGTGIGVAVATEYDLETATILDAEHSSISSA